MKKNNNKYRNNSNMYNLNYRFDSLSPAGKCSGTALDLIKRYNELAKEAHSAGNYVEMEVFRQYAEHYRKIVTEINERKNNIQSSIQNQASQMLESMPQITEVQTKENNADEKELTSSNDVVTQEPLSLKKKTLKIVEVKSSQILDQDEKESKPKRTYKRKPKKELDQTADAV